MTQEQSWTDAANSEGGEHADLMAEGYHQATIVKAIRFKQNGDEMRSDKGPFVMLVYENASGAQATESLWLTAKAKWRLARTCQNLGFDIQRMDENGVTVESFENEDFCKKQFEGRKAWVNVTHRNDRANAEAVSEDDVPAWALKRDKQEAAPQGSHEPLEDDSIPF